MLVWRKKDRQEVNVLLKCVFISQLLTLMPADRILNPWLHSSECSQSPGLTGTWPLMMTSSAKRTLTGLVFNFAFLAALMNADLGDFDRKKRGKPRLKNQHSGEVFYLAKQSCSLWNHDATKRAFCAAGFYIISCLSISGNNVRYTIILFQVVCELAISILKSCNLIPTDLFGDLPSKVAGHMLICSGHNVLLTIWCAMPGGSCQMGRFIWGLLENVTTWEVMELRTPFEPVGYNKANGYGNIDRVPTWTYGRFNHLFS